MCFLCVLSVLSFLILIIPMKLDISDLKRLYGPVLFVLAEEEVKENEVPLTEETEPQPEVEKAAVSEISETDEKPAEEAIPPELLQGSPVDWKLKKNATVAFVMDLQEFKNRHLTGFLKTAMQEAQIPLDQVGFGIIDSQANSWNFSDLPVERVWVFGTSVSFRPGPWQMDQKLLYIHDTLTILIQDQSKKDLFIQQLSK
jgi:hypothetical protein